MRIWVEWAVGGLRAVEVCCYRWGCCWRGLTGERDCRSRGKGKGAAGLEARVEREGLGGWRCGGQWLAKIEDEDGWLRK